MSKLIITLNPVDKKWDEYLTETFGDDFVKNSKVEPFATAKKNKAKVYNLNFKGDTKIIDTIKQNNDIDSAYIVENNKIKEVIK